MKSYHANLGAGIEGLKLREHDEPRPGKHPVLASRTMYVDDPDGNEVEFICRSPAS